MNTKMKMKNHRIKKLNKDPVISLFINMSTQFFRPPSKYDFFLPGIDPVAIEMKYNLFGTNIERKSNLTTGTTLVKSIYFDQSRTYSYVDTTRRNRNWVITMKDFLNKKEMPTKWDGKCCGCHSQFKTRPLGCPIKFVPSELVSTYYSDLSKGMVSFTKKLARREASKMKYVTLKEGERLIENDYYETAHIFCSFDCIVGFIEDNQHNPLYKESMKETYNLYYDFFGERAVKIPRSPSYFLKKEYGGDLTEEEYAKSFKNIIYVNLNQTYNKNPVMYPIGTAFEKLVSF